MWCHKSSSPSPGNTILPLALQEPHFVDCVSSRRCGVFCQLWELCRYTASPPPHGSYLSVLTMLWSTDIDLPPYSLKECSRWLSEKLPATLPSFRLSLPLLFLDSVNIHPHLQSPTRTELKGELFHFLIWTLTQPSRQYFTAPSDKLTEKAPPLQMKKWTKGRRNRFSFASSLFLEVSALCIVSQREDCRVAKPHCQSGLMCFSVKLRAQKSAEDPVGVLWD